MQFDFLVLSEDSQSKSQVSNVKTARNVVIDTIELLDSDSEGPLKKRTESPTVHGWLCFQFIGIVSKFSILSSVSQVAGKCEANTSDYVVPDIKELDNEYESLMQAMGCVPHEQFKHTTKCNDTPLEAKKLSFTERLELFEQDMLNGFTADLPADILNQSQHQLSQESIDLSDDEINYSMRNGPILRSAVDDDDDDGDDWDHHRAECDNDVRSPIEFDLNSNSNSNSNHVDAEQTLVNQSVCNIFEKTFEKYVSPLSVKKKSRGAKTLKKFQSETVLNTQYGQDAPSTSTASNRRIQMTPTKNQFQSKSPQKNSKYSPISQPPIETRMDLSNDEYHIRIGSISPKPNYEQMDACTLEMELRKYGLKPSLSRRQAIICLEYIYNRTHPFMDGLESGADLGNSLKSTKCSSSSNNQLNVVDEAISTAVNGIAADSNDPQINFNVGFAAHNLADEKFKCRPVDKVFLPSMLRAKVSLATN